MNCKSGQRVVFRNRLKNPSIQLKTAWFQSAGGWTAGRSWVLFYCIRMPEIFILTRLAVQSTLDFEIGKQIAKVTGTRHTAYNLSDHRYTMDELLDVSKRIDHQCLLFCHPPVPRVSAAVFKSPALVRLHGRYAHGRTFSKTDILQPR